MTGTSKSGLLSISIVSSLEVPLSAAIPDDIPGVANEVDEEGRELDDVPVFCIFFGGGAIGAIGFVFCLASLNINRMSSTFWMIFVAASVSFFNSGRVNWGALDDALDFGVDFARGVSSTAVAFE